MLPPSVDPVGAVAAAQVVVPDRLVAAPGASLRGAVEVKGAVVAAGVGVVVVAVIAGLHARLHDAVAQRAASQLLRQASVSTLLPSSQASPGPSTLSPQR